MTLNDFFFYITKYSNKNSQQKKEYEANDYHVLEKKKPKKFKCKMKNNMIVTKKIVTNTFFFK